MQNALTLLDSLLATIETSGTMQISLSDLPTEQDECKLSSWVKVSADSHFPIQNIPFGVFEKADGSQRIGTRIGDYVLDLHQVSKLGLFALLPENGKCFQERVLNSFMSYDRSTWRRARRIIQYLLSSNSAKPLLEKYLYEAHKVSMLLPCRIGDYTDFYSSRNHATNVGIMFRGKDNALQPNWLHLPVGYHGRASSVVVSDTPVRRPCGQLKKDITDRSVPPSFGPCKLLDIELEVGFFFGGKSNKIGNPIRISDAYDHIFGMVLMNDWSARDIQKWEYVPLGPFNAKNFCTTISPWIVTMDALKPLKLPLVKQEPALLPYLCDKEDFLLDVALDVFIQTKQMKERQLLTRSNTKYLYYSCHQQLAHHSITGCPFNAGDLLGSGTISGTKKEEYGSMLELSWAGKEPMKLKDGSSRTFLQDGDKITITGCQKSKNGNFCIGFGECAGVILPAHDPTLLGKL
mmetsp:Transcript_12914/g.20514  ORF Transcript_12914/g.20514 Transcript_12914/m.20514 type:complete len:462 (-) Transcript_12914:104-1489(-)|eukprot:CAMPEP_0197032502 /NCGR_PEP_ID=MMETSP1384-20130603/11170_1 /TAXON_ID=29189 /ORGANISM="Ammonia sp." /LENGTH=461 /DNA_ID=CAMNT_0042462179 /DNA_START=37 /DNA_END=1422 /DNA_ORIENTATION=-